MRTAGQRRAQGRTRRQQGESTTSDDGDMAGRVERGRERWQLHKVDGLREECDALPTDDLRALHRRDGPGGSHGKEGLGPIPEVGQCGR